jgi:hypothetical protein
MLFNSQQKVQMQKQATEKICILFDVNLGDEGGHNGERDRDIVLLN